MLFQNSVDFGTTDPVFGIDIGFYVFRLPFWQYLLNTAFTITVLALLGALAVHYLYGGVRLSGPGDRMTAGARAHLTGLVALFVILKAIAYVLDQRALLLDTISGTKLTGAGYTAINALLPAKEMLTYISIIVAVAILVFSNAVMRNLVWPGVALGLLGVSAVAIGGIYPWGVQSFQVDPSRNVKEAEYFKRAIDNTRTAFDLDITKKVDYRSGVVDPPATLAKDTTVVPTIRVLDPAVVSEAFTQLSQVRSFYHFGDKLDIDRYKVDGKEQDYVVGLRELNYDALTGTQDNWINRHTIYTHGYGLVAAPANELCAGSGSPKFVSGFFAGNPQTSGCVSTSEQIKVTQPRVYYGEQMKEYAVVGKGNAEAPHQEYDRPVSETDDENYTYQGGGGVSIGSTWRRLLYSIKFAESSFLLADAVNNNSKILYERDPRHRVEKVAPFLTLDGDPYPAAVNGRIVWIIDGYTTSANYPYSKRVDLQDATSDSLTGDGTFRLERKQVNYIRNSVKATVDAYDGTVTLYEFDDKDPLLKAWNNAFGGKLIKPKTEIPKELEEHFRYPADMFKVQRDLLTQFHVTEAGEFFTEADFWTVPERPGQHHRQCQAAAVLSADRAARAGRDLLPDHLGGDPARQAEHGRADLRHVRRRQARVAPAGTGQGQPDPRTGHRPAEDGEQHRQGLRGPRRPWAARALEPKRGPGQGQPAVAAVRRRHALRRADLPQEHRREILPAVPAGTAQLRGQGRLRQRRAVGHHTAAGQCPASATDDGQPTAADRQ